MCGAAAAGRLGRRRVFYASVADRALTRHAANAANASAVVEGVLHVPVRCRCPASHTSLGDYHDDRADIFSQPAILVICIAHYARLTNQWLETNIRSKRGLEIEAANIFYCSIPILESPLLFKQKAPSGGMNERCAHKGILKSRKGIEHELGSKPSKSADSAPPGESNNCQPLSSGESSFR